MLENIIFDITGCKMCSTIIFVVVCIRSAEFKLASVLRSSSRNVKRPHDADAFSSRIKSGIPIKSTHKYLSQIL